MILIILILYINIIIYILKDMQMLQQNYYNENNRYLIWIFKHININYINIFLFIINFINIYLNNKFILYLNLLLLINIFKKINISNKVPLKYTNRIYRLCITTLIILVLPLLISNKYIIILVLSIYLLFNKFILYIVNIINKLPEKIIFNYYKNKALKKLNKCNVSVIGITGSYGKTTTKNILNTIINTKYNTLQTPGSFNTLYGLMKTINNDLNKYYDYFITEMGAFKVGSIKRLCDFVKPKYAILTTIGLSHLDTFKSVDNIVKGKFELIDSLNEDGVAILNKDDEKQVNYKSISKCKKIWIGINNECDVRAFDIKTDISGTSFSVYFKESNEYYKFKTKLLGYFNIYNILSSIALLKYLGLSNEEIDIGIRKLEPVKHRLELKKYNDITIIDDAYNSNPVGARMGLDTLKLFNGLKVIVTPGLVEYGYLQNKLNKEFGVNISIVCNKVILVGKNQTKSIYEGLISSNFNTKDIYIIDNFNECFSIIKDLKKEYKDLVVLIENDLPDIYT